MRIKICGIRDITDARTAIRAGANAVGFLVGITHLAEDKVSKEEAKEIISQLPPFVSRVMVTHLTEKDEIVELARFLAVDTVQLHDDVAPEDVTSIREELSNCKIIKTIHVQEREETLQKLEQFEKYCDAILLDSRTKERIGGTGLTHDWDISREIVEKAKAPVILAGGLTPQNVYEAVKRVHPYAVDVNSGVEEDGYKSGEKIKAFIKNALKAEEEYR